MDVSILPQREHCSPKKMNTGRGGGGMGGGVDGLGQ